MGRGIEKALDIQIEHPVHLLPVNPGVECVQRIVLAAPRETVAAISTRCRFIASVLKVGRIRAAPLPCFGQTAPKM